MRTVTNRRQSQDAPPRRDLRAVVRKRYGDCEGVEVAARTCCEEAALPCPEYVRC